MMMKRKNTLIRRRQIDGEIDGEQASKHEGKKLHKNINEKNERERLKINRLYINIKVF